MKRVKKKEKAVLHTVSWRYDDGQFYNEGVLMTPRQAKRLEKKLQTRVDAEVIAELIVAEDAKPLGFVDMLDSVVNNDSLHWDLYPEV